MYKMLKKSLFICIFFISSSLFALDVNDKSLKDINDNKINKEFYPNGQLKSEIPYLNNKPEGKARFYTPTGNLKYENYYKNGVVQVFYLYDEKGYKTIMPCRKGIPHGLAITYFSNGKIRKKIPMRNGRIHGKQIVYREDGTLLEEVWYKKGIYHGPQKAYYRNGNLKKIIHFKNEEFHGKAKSYYENGNVKRSFTIHNGYIKGLITQYKPDGTFDKKFKPDPSEDLLGF